MDSGIRSTRETKATESLVTLPEDSCADVLPYCGEMEPSQCWMTARVYSLFLPAYNARHLGRIFSSSRHRAVAAKKLLGRR